MEKANFHCPTCYCSPLSNSRDGLSVCDVDGRIRALQEEVRLLKSYRNILLPIHQLPSELLLSTFRLVLNSPSLIPSFMVLTRIASVCTHWRALCTRDPTLWTNITSWNIDIVDCSLQRSKSLPVLMNLYLSNDHIDYCRPNFLELPNHNTAKRLQSLNISTRYTRCFEEVLQSLEEAEELPLLEDLLLESRDDVSKVAFSCNAPRLTTLSLTNIFLKPLLLSNLSNLRHLRAHYSGFWVLANPTLTQWLDLLAELGELEVLDLSYPLFIEDETCNSEKRIIQLKTLRRLAFHESVTDSIRFLPHLMIPAEAQTELSFQASSPELRDQIDSASSLVKPWILPRDAVSPIQCLALHSPAFSKEPRVAFSYASFFDPLWQSGRLISIKFVDDGVLSPLLPTELASSLSFSDMIAGMKPAAFTPRLHELAIDGASVAMIYALQQYEWLDTLILSGGLWPRCIEELLSLSREERLSALSKIHTLVLRGIPFHWLEQHKLLAALEGSSVESVHIEASTGVSHEDVGAIRDVIGAVTWDGA